MKTSKKHLSNTSFVVSLIKLFVVRTQKQAIVKVEVFVLFVGLCILMRYTMISSNINSGSNSRRVVVELKSLRLPVWPPEMVIKSNLYNYRLYHRPEVRKSKYKLDKTSLRLIKLD